MSRVNSKKRSKRGGAPAKKVRGRVPDEQLHLWHFDDGRTVLAPWPWDRPTTAGTPTGAPPAVEPVSHPGS